MKQADSNSSLKKKDYCIKPIKHRTSDGITKNRIKIGWSEREKHNTMALVKKRKWLLKNPAISEQDILINN